MARLIPCLASRCRASASQCISTHSLRDGAMPPHLGAWCHQAMPVRVACLRSFSGAVLPRAPPMLCSTSPCRRPTQHHDAVPQRRNAVPQPFASTPYFSVASLRNALYRPSHAALYNSGSVRDQTLPAPLASARRHAHLRPCWAVRLASLPMPRAAAPVRSIPAPALPPPCFCSPCRYLAVPGCANA